MNKLVAARILIALLLYEGGVWFERFSRHDELPWWFGPFTPPIVVLLAALYTWSVFTITKT